MIEKTKILRLGRVRAGDVFVKITVTREDGKTKLSFVGVEGPMSNGDARGSCGQIEMDLKPESFVEFAPGWSAEAVEKLLATWRAWHLNDMRAGCEHQRAAWHPEAEITLTKYGIEWPLVRQLEKDTQAAMEATYSFRADLTDQHAVNYARKYSGAAELLYAIRFELGLESYSWKTMDPEWFESIARRTHNFEQVRPHIKTRTEKKTAGWVYPKEHKDGLLGKPCETCGYEYGTQWLHEPVPDEVLNYLGGLPSTDKQPAWV